MSKSNQYDAIVIGSGIGGLTTAAILSQFNHKKVLVLEQHFLVGGFIQEFKRQGFQWDIGVQAVTEIAKGDIGRVIFDYITEGKLQWQKLPNPSDKLIYPDFTFDIYANPPGYISKLIQMFSTEKTSIQRYFSDLKKVTLWYRINLMADFLPKWFQPIIKSCLRKHGIPSIPDRFSQKWISTKTPIKNLYLTGTDALVHGIVGATIGGAIAAGIINGWFGFLKVMFAIISKVQKY